MRGTSIAVVLSAVLHVVLLVVLLIAPRFSDPSQRRISAPEWLIALARPVVGERFIVLERPEPRVAAPARPAPAAPATPLEMPTVLQPAPALSAPEPGAAPAPSALVGSLGEPAGGAGAESDPGSPGPVTAAERLRPGEKDPRLWYVLPDEIVGLSTDQRLQLELALAIAAARDSTDAAIAAGRAFTDWTYVDEQGRRWGISPGQIHLGEITIPFPFGFEPPPNSMAARRTAENAAIAAQAARQETRQSLRDRASEIRRRRDADRARSRGDTATATDR